MRRCIIVSSLFRTFPGSGRQVLNLNAGKAYLVESVFFATSGLWESNPLLPRPRPPHESITTEQTRAGLTNILNLKGLYWAEPISNLQIPLRLRGRTFSSLTLACDTLLPCFLIRLLEKVGEVQECCMTELELAEVRSYTTIVFLLTLYVRYDIKLYI